MGLRRREDHGKHNDLRELKLISVGRRDSRSWGQTEMTSACGTVAYILDVGRIKVMVKVKVTQYCKATTTDKEQKLYQDYLNAMKT